MHSIGDLNALNNRRCKLNRPCDYGMSVQSSDDRILNHTLQRFPEGTMRAHDCNLTGNKVFEHWFFVLYEFVLQMYSEIRDFRMTPKTYLAQLISYCFQTNMFDKGISNTLTVPQCNVCTTTVGSPNHVNRRKGPQLHLNCANISSRHCSDIRCRTACRLTTCQESHLA